MDGVAHFISGHEQTHFNRVCFFHFFGVVLASKESKYSELIKSNAPQDITFTAEYVNICSSCN